MSYFEYKCQMIFGNQCGHIDEQMNSFASKGWMLHSVSSGRDGHHFMWWEREVMEQQDEAPARADNTESINDFINTLSAKGISQMFAISAIRDQYMLSLGSAKKLIDAHPAYRQAQDTNETVRDRVEQALLGDPNE